MPGEEIFHLSVSELAKRIEAKKLSPVELTQIYLDRSQKLGPRYNAYALLTPEIALDHAREERIAEATGMNHPDYKYNPGSHYKSLTPEERARIIDDEPLPG